MGFVYKQTYVDAGRVPRESIPGMNVRYLQYIATRPGAVYNPGCGFGLWGKLGPDDRVGNIDSLEKAKDLLRADSERGRTAFRAIISLGEPDAGERGYYDRAPWERLINENITEIAKGMHIAPQDLRWVASMHNEARHPHVHLVFWDAGTQPRQDFMPPVKFEAFSERIRANLNRCVFGQEIRQEQEAQKELLKSAREELQAMFTDANPTAVFSASRMINREEFTEIAERMQELVKNAPKSGSLKYQYLRDDYKEQLKELLDKIKQLPFIREKLEAYLAATKQISVLYGNGEPSQEKQLLAAMEKFDKALGNEVMDAVREILQELELDAPSDADELREIAETAVCAALNDSEAYQALLQQLPPERIPMETLRENEAVRSVLADITDTILSDASVRALIRGYANKQCPANATPEQKKQAQKDASAAFRRAAAQAFMKRLTEDMGYTRECVRTHTLYALMRSFSLLSQLTGQSRAKCNVAQRSRELSAEARKDRQQRRSQGSSLELE